MKLKALSIVSFFVFLFGQSALCDEILYFKFMHVGGEVPISIPGELTLENVIAQIKMKMEIPKDLPVRLIFAGQMIDTNDKLNEKLKQGYGRDQAEPFNVIYNLEKALEWQKTAGG